MEWTSSSKSNICASAASRDRNAIQKGPCRGPSFLADHCPCGPGNSSQKPVFVLDFLITYDIFIARDNPTFPFWNCTRPFRVTQQPFLEATNVFLMTCALLFFNDLR